MNQSSSNLGICVSIAISGICAFLLMLWITHIGPGVSPDSITYIETARSLLSGKGFYVGSLPMTHFPPAYPLLLSIFGYFHHGDILQAGRLLGALLFAVNLALVAIAVWTCTAQSLLATGISMALFLCSAPIQGIHSMIWSEPLFITFTLTAMLLFNRYTTNTSLLTLASAALMTGLAMATRYAGAPLLLALVLAILICSHQPIGKKVKASILLSLIATLPTAFWLIRNTLTAQTPVDRSPAIHYFDASHAKWLINTLHDFALPIQIPIWTKAVYLVIGAVFFAVALTILRRQKFPLKESSSAGNALPVICILFAIAYLLFLVVAVSFFDAGIPMDHRLVLPAFLAIAISGISLAWSLSRVRSQRFIRYSFAVLLLLSIGLNVNDAISFAVYTHDHGCGYSSRVLQQSELLKFLESNPDNFKIYSNGPDVIRFRTNKHAIMIPPKHHSGSLRKNMHFENQIALMFEECKSGHALIVYFDWMAWRHYLPTREELKAMNELPSAHNFKDGVIFGNLKLDSPKPQD